MREQLLFVKKKTKKTPQLLLDEVKPSIQESRFLHIFWKLYSMKQIAEQGISGNDIINYCSLYNHNFSMLELDLIRDLDRTVLSEMDKTRSIQWGHVSKAV